MDLGLDRDTTDTKLTSTAPFDSHELATKADLQHLPTKADLEVLRGEMATKHDIRVGFESTRAEMRCDRPAFRSEMAARRPEVATMRCQGLSILLALRGLTISATNGGWVGG